jgi:hypothetical protein
MLLDVGLVSTGVLRSSQVKGQQDCAVLGVRLRQNLGASATATIHPFRPIGSSAGTG